MNHLSKLIIIIFSLFFHVNAQDMSRTYPNPLHTVHPSIAVIIGILSIMFSMTFLLLAYAKLCHTNPFNIFNRGVHHQNLHALSRSRSRFSGIDKTVIESLPFFRFSSLKGSKEGLECAVCISRFEDAEVLRLLPKCKHAFHLNCIDQWLESHSSCPLCRYKFDLKDLTSFTYSSSLRFLRSHSNLSEDPNLELFVQRQPDLQGSSRFSIGGSFRKMDPGKEEELLIQEAGDLKHLHKFKHKIIISDVVIKNRWSDVNPSDLLFLNSEMINVMSSKRFSPSESNGLSNNEQIEKIKEDMERKRLYESKFSNINESFASTSNSEVNSTRQLDPAEKRSMSEITNVSRFRDYSMKSRSKESLAEINGKEERVRRIWLPIARRTVQWFAGRERSTQELEIKRQSFNV